MSTLSCTSDGTTNGAEKKMFVKSPSHPLRPSGCSTSSVIDSEVNTVIEEIVDFIATSPVTNIPWYDPIPSSVNSHLEEIPVPNLSNVVPIYPAIGKSPQSLVSISVFDSNKVFDLVKFL